MPILTIRGTTGALGLPRTLELDETTLALRGGLRRRVVSRAGARVRLGAWVLPGVWTAIGAVLSVEGREGKLRIGAQGRTIALADRTMPPEKAVDLVVGDADFDALRAALLPDAPAAAARRGGPAVFEVVRNEGSGLRALRRLRPGLLTILVLGIVGPLGGMLIGDSPVGIAVLTVVELVVVVVGLIATFRGANRPPAPHRLEVGDESIVLRDPNGELVLELRKADLTIRRGVHRVSASRGGFRVPTIELVGGAAGARAELRLGVWESRLVGEEGDRKMRAPRFLVGAPEWGAVVGTIEDRELARPTAGAEAAEP